MMQEYFQFLNQYYDKVYVLSIESASARRELFAQRFKGLDYTFFFGADKNKFSIEEAQANNIFNEKYSDFLGAEMPGRWIAFGLKMKF